MNKRTLSLSLICLLVSAASFAPAYAQELAPPAAHSAVGAWVGGVSWSERMVFYSWEIVADGTFSSGREGRGHDGGGVWIADGDTLTLKYDDGFRYEGTLSDADYFGTAYGADGRARGDFSMSRAVKRVGEAPVDDY